MNEHYFLKYLPTYLNWNEKCQFLTQLKGPTKNKNTFKVIRVAKTANKIEKNTIEISIF